ncbi:MAG: alpha/beta fold hydrolase, partial [Betaproteobacteria bacterium]
MTSSTSSPGSALQAISLSSAGMLEQFLRELPSAGNADIPTLLQLFTSGNESQREKLRALEEKFYVDHLSLWTQLSGAVDGTAGAFAQNRDRRFDAPEWRLPFFQYLQQAYLLNSRFLLDLGELPDLEPHAKRRLQFQLRQMADALSPNNFATTNPEVIKLAAQTGGESLAQGMKMLASDVARGRISMTDERAFEVGRNLAVTPGAVIYENEVMQLIQYAPTTAEVREPPLLIVPPFINKYYILDLQPENSFVRFCVAQGFTTFIISWRNIPPELGHLGWDDYIQKAVLAPLDVIQAITNVHKIHTLGFCVGGTLLASALALMAARKEDEVASLTLLATMLDFSDPGEISVYIDCEFVERCEQEFCESGAMSGSKLAQTFASLRANDLIWHFVVNNYLKGRVPRAFDLLYWNTDGSNVPGR